MSTGDLRTFRTAADCSTLTLWEEVGEEAGATRTKSGPPPASVPVAVADVTRKLRAVGKGGEDRTESFLFTVRPELRMSLRGGDVVESLVGSGVLEGETRKGDGAARVVVERTPVMVAGAGEGIWVFRKLDLEPTLIRVVGKAAVGGTGPRPKCLQPPLRCDP